MSNWIVMAYGLLVLLGGMIGFATVHSTPSLIMGTIFSVGLIVSSVLMFKGKKNGEISAQLLSAVLAIFFAYRFILTGKMMPAGMMCVLSIIVLTLVFITSRNKK